MSGTGRKMPPENHKKPGGTSVGILLDRWRSGTFREIFDDWRWIFSYSARYKGAMLLYIILGVLSTTLGLVSSVAGKYLVDIITGYQTSKIALMAVVMVSTALAGLLLRSVISRLSARMTISINNDIQADVFERLMDADWLSLSGYASGDLLSRFNKDVETVGNHAISWLPTIVIAVYRFFATFFLILHYDPIMAVIALSSAPFLLLSSRFLIRRQREYGQKMREMNSQMTAFETEAFYHADTIKGFGAGRQYGEKLHWWQKCYRDVVLRYNRFTIEANVLMTVLGTGVQMLAFGYCLFRLWTHDITYGTMILFLQQRSSFSGAFNSLVSVVPDFLSGSISAHRLRELWELPGENHVPDSSRLEPLREQGLQVELRDIDFAYAPGKPVLSASSFRAAPGEIVALVGPSGEGKTTLIRLMLGLIHPDAGEAVLRAMDGTEVPMNADTRHLISYVPQGNTLLSGTIAENLRLGKPEATEEEIVEALQVAAAWEFVKKLPEGIHTVLGERGHGVSEGQAQRLAIARAVLRDAPVLLLDEATSALDVATERQVLRNLLGHKTLRTCVVSTHRPSVLDMSRRVYRVMDTHLTELSQGEAQKMSMDF